MSIPIIGPILDVITNLGGRFMERQIIIADGKMEIAKARANAHVSIQASKAIAEVEWEKSMADASKTSWKDELWTIYFVVILTIAFIPGAEPYIKSGFEQIASLPDWFGTAVLVAIGAAFGKNIVRDVVSLKK